MYNDTLASTVHQLQ